MTSAVWKIAAAAVVTAPQSGQHLFRPLPVVGFCNVRMVGMYNENGSGFVSAVCRTALVPVVLYS